MMHRFAFATTFWCVAVLPACSLDPAPRRADCDPGRGPCAAETAFGRVTLDISPRPIAAMAPLQVLVTAGEPLDDVAIELNGRDMDMGPNVARLAAQTGLRWQGTTTLPVCLTGRMRWDATLTLRRGARSERLNFGFEAG